MRKIIKIKQSYMDYEKAILIENNNKLVDIIDELQSEINGLCNINENFVSIIEQMKQKQNTMENDIQKLCENQNCIENNVNKGFKTLDINTNKISEKEYEDFIESLRKSTFLKASIIKGI